MKDTLEQWRPVVGYEGLYEVSDLGRVRSLDRFVSHRYGGQQLKRGKVLAPCCHRHGYPKVGLWKNGAQKVPCVHVLVAAAFLGPCPAGMEVLHGKNGCKDCHLSNLRYGTHKQNGQDMLRDGTAQTGTKQHASKLTEEDVREIRESTEPGVTLARRYGVGTAQVSRIRNGRNWAWLDAG